MHTIGVIKTTRHPLTHTCCTDGQQGGSPAPYYWPQARRILPRPQNHHVRPCSGLGVCFGSSHFITTSMQPHSKTEVQNLLESAGFSRANPYYVVQQGKVCGQPCALYHDTTLCATTCTSHSTGSSRSMGPCCTSTRIPPLQIVHLSTMKDAQRLELLKEVGGTKTYEERRTESKRILDDTTRKLREIESVVRVACCSCCCDTVMTGNCRCCLTGAPMTRAAVRRCPPRLVCPSHHPQFLYSWRTWMARCASWTRSVLSWRATRMLTRSGGALSMPSTTASSRR